MAWPFGMQAPWLGGRIDEYGRMVVHRIDIELVCVADLDWLVGEAGIDGSLFKERGKRRGSAGYWQICKRSAMTKAFLW